MTDKTDKTQAGEVTLAQLSTMNVSQRLKNMAQANFIMPDEAGAEAFKERLIHPDLRKHITTEMCIACAEFNADPFIYTLGGTPAPWLYNLATSYWGMEIGLALLGHGRNGVDDAHWGPYWFSRVRHYLDRAKTLGTAQLRMIIVGPGYVFANFDERMGRRLLPSGSIQLLNAVKYHLNYAEKTSPNQDRRAITMCHPLNGEVIVDVYGNPSTHDGEELRPWR